MCLPLADQGGVVEWVLRTSTYQSVLKQSFLRCGVALDKLNPGKLRPEWEQVRGSNGGAGLVKWLQARLADTPSVMHTWWLAKCAAAPFMS